MKKIVLGLMGLFVSATAWAADPAMSIDYKLNGYGALKSDKIVVDAIPDPKIKGVTCWFSRAKLGGVSGSFGVADDPTELGLSCRVTGPISITGKLETNEVVFKESRNWNGIKTVQIKRECDAKNNTLIYIVYSDYLIDGSPKHAMDVVPLLNGGSCK